MKKFKLLKELPGVKVGAVFQHCHIIDAYIPGTTKDHWNCCAFTLETIEANPSWFEPISDQSYNPHHYLIDPTDITKTILEVAIESCKRRGE